MTTTFQTVGELNETIQALDDEALALQRQLDEAAHAKNFSAVTAALVGSEAPAGSTVDELRQRLDQVIARRAATATARDVRQKLDDDARAEEQIARCQRANLAELGAVGLLEATMADLLLRLEDLRAVAAAAEAERRKARKLRDAGVMTVLQLNDCNPVRAQRWSTMSVADRKTGMPLHQTTPGENLAYHQARFREAMLQLALANPQPEFMAAWAGLRRAKQAVADQDPGLAILLGVQRSEG